MTRRSPAPRSLARRAAAAAALVAAAVLGGCNSWFYHAPSEKNDERETEAAETAQAQPAAEAEMQS